MDWSITLEGKQLLSTLNNKITTLKTQMSPWLFKNYWIQEQFNLNYTTYN
jgi:hypothetical protein